MELIEVDQFIEELRKAICPNDLLNQKIEKHLIITSSQFPLLKQLCDSWRELIFLRNEYERQMDQRKRAKQILRKSLHSGERQKRYRKALEAAGLIRKGERVGNHDVGEIVHNFLEMTTSQKPRLTADSVDLSEDFTLDGWRRMGSRFIRQGSTPISKKEAYITLGQIYDIKNAKAVQMMVKRYLEKEKSRVLIIDKRNAAIARRTQTLSNLSKPRRNR